MRRLLAVVALLPACQCFTAVRDCSLEPCEPEPTQPLPPPTTVEELFEAIIPAAVCGQNRACGTALPGLSCEAQLWGNRYSTLDPVWLKQRVDAGAVVIDFDAGMACLAAYQTVCRPNCWPPLIGLLPEGAVCESYFDCRDGLYCTGNACPLRCARKLGDGAGTNDLSACGTTSWTLLRDGGTRCFNALSLGASCEPARDERPDIFRPCDTGLACAPADGGRRCSPQVGPGAPCLGDDCGSAHECRGQPLRCVPLAKLGESCGPFGDTRFPRCLAGLSCSNGKCVAAHTTEGAACQIQSAECAPPLACSSSSRTCVKLSSTGGPCGSPFDCGDFHDECVGGRCTRGLTNGAACSSHQECGHDLVCVKGRCDHFRCE